MLQTDRQTDSNMERRTIPAWMRSRLRMLAASEERSSCTHRCGVLGTLTQLSSSSGMACRHGPEKHSADDIFFFFRSYVSGIYSEFRTSPLFFGDLLAAESTVYCYEYGRGKRNTAQTHRKNLALGLFDYRQSRTAI